MSLNDTEKEQEVAGLLEAINQVDFQTFYEAKGDDTDSGIAVTTVLENWQNAVNAQIDFEGKQAITGTAITTENLTSGDATEIEIKLELTLSDGTKVNDQKAKITVYSWRSDYAANTLQTAIASIAGTQQPVEAASDDAKDIRVAAEEKAEELKEIALSNMESAGGQDTARAYILKTYLNDISFVESEDWTPTTDNTWTACVAVAGQGVSRGVSSNLINIKYKVTASTEAKDILESLKPNEVTVTTTTGTVPSTTVEEDEFKTYFGGTYNTTNAIARAILNAHEDIQSVTLNGTGAITGNPGSQSWIGAVIITLKDEKASTATGIVEVPLTVEKSNTKYTDISVTDNRADSKVKKGELYGLDGVTVTLTKEDGKKEVIADEELLDTEITDKKIVIDNGNYNNEILGTYNITIRIAGDNSQAVSIPVQVYDTAEITAADAKLPNNAELKSIKSEDESILKYVAAEDSNLEVYKAGTTYVTVTDTDGNSNRVKCVVDAEGNVTYSTDFEAYQVDKIIGDDGFAVLAEGQDVTVSVKDSEIASASYTEDAAGNGHVKITPNAVGKTTLTVNFGSDHKISYEYTLKISKTGAVTLDLGSKKAPMVQDVTLPDVTKSALQDAVYFGTTESGAENTDPKTSKKVIDAAVDTDDLLVKVTTSRGTDTVKLSTASYVFETAKYKDEASSIKVTFGKGSNDDSATVSKITLKQKLECGNDRLAINAVDFDYVDDAAKYVAVSKEKNDDGNEIYVITPVKGMSNTDWSVIFTDKNGAKTTVSATSGNDYWLGTCVFNVPSVKDASPEFTKPSKVVYTIGEKFDVSGAEFSYTPSEVAGEFTVDITADMFTSAGKTLDLTKAGSYKDVVFSYGDYTSDEFTITVNAAERKFSASELNVPAGDKISSMAVKSAEKDAVSVSNYAEDFAYFKAAKTNTSASVTITTVNGKTVNVLVKVDENGNITADGEVQFKGQQAAVTEEELNLTPEKADSSNSEVATAEVQGKKVVIKSLSAGSTVVTVTDKDGNKATINVTVAADGSITTDVKAYNSDGWVDLGGGDWGYIQDGKRVVSKWIYVVEEDPYNNNEVGKVWYHFGADGKMQRGWISDPEVEWRIYLLDSNGRMMHSDWVVAPEQKELNRPAGIYHLNADGSVQMNGWALAKNSDSIYWLCNAGNGLFEKDNPASWASEKLW